MSHMRVDNFRKQTKCIYNDNNIAINVFYYISPDSLFRAIY